jgi:hypothetical protein
METLLSALFGAVVGFALAHYQVWLKARGSVRPLSVKLAALAIRTRTEVLYQFVELHEGQWVPEALRRQNYLLEDMETLSPLIQAHGGELQLYVWAAREALESNMAILSSWQNYKYAMGPDARPHSAAPIDHISTETVSHHDLFAAAQLLTRAVNSIQGRAARREAQRFAERISELRAAGSAATVRNPTIQYLQTVDKSAQLEWVRTGIVPPARG